MKQDRYTVFDEARVAQKTPVIDLNAVHGLSLLRDDQQTSGTGAVTDVQSEFRVRHQAAGDFARLSSASRGRYQPGTIGEVGIGMRLDTIPTTGDFEIIWGYFDMQMDAGTNTQNIENGMVFGIDQNGEFIAVYKAGTEIEKVYSDNWNGRDADAHNLTEGTIFQIDFLYYGYGTIKFKYVESNAGKQETRVLHTFSNTGGTTVDNTNLQVGGYVKSTDSTDDFSLYLAGRQFNVVGNYTPQRRLNSVRNDGVATNTTTFVPVASVRKRFSRREVASNVFGFDLISTTDAYVQIRYNSTLTGATFTALDEQPADETGLEQDTSATAIDTATGIKLFEGVVTGGGGSQKTSLSSVTDLPVDVPDEGIITLTAKAVDTGGTVTGVLKMQEVF